LEINGDSQIVTPSPWTRTRTEVMNSLHFEVKTGGKKERTGNQLSRIVLSGSWWGEENACETWSWSDFASEAYSWISWTNKIVKQASQQRFQCHSRFQWHNPGLFTCWVDQHAWHYYSLFGLLFNPPGLINPPGLNNRMIEW